MFTLLVFTVFFFLEILKKKKKKSFEKKKKKKKKSSENDQSTGHFQSFFFLFFRPLDPKSEKKSRKSINKKILALLESENKGANQTALMQRPIYVLTIRIQQSKGEGKYQKSIQSSTTPDPGRLMGK